MHQGIGLGAFNEMPTRKAVHALYECCNSLTLARDLARARAYADHDALYRRADALLFALSEPSVDLILEACPHLGTRPRSAKSHAEQCSVWDDRAEVMTDLSTAAQPYTATFGLRFVMFVGGLGSSDVLTAIRDRLHHDVETERKSSATSSRRSTEPGSSACWEPKVATRTGDPA